MFENFQVDVNLAIELRVVEACHHFHRNGSDSRDGRPHPHFDVGVVAFSDDKSVVVGDGGDAIDGGAFPVGQDNVADTQTRHSAVIFRRFQAEILERKGVFPVFALCNGDGGLQKLFVGLGGRIGHFSAGFNVGYLWGGYTHNIALSSSTAVNSLFKKYEADVSSYTLDFGLQYELSLGKKDKLMLGATYGLGHKLNADATCDIINSNNTISKADSTHLLISNALELPHTFGVGLAYSHLNTLTIGVDGTMQRWGDLDFPKESDGKYQLTSGVLKDSYKVTFGTEWTPRHNSRRLIDRVKYRIGASYMTPYYKIGAIDGPKQFSVSAGFGIPIQNQINARSYLNISAQWVKQSVDGLLKENTFRINLGVTFNERWFAKWKVE